MDVIKARDFIIEELRTRLAPDLYYHGLHHTLDVLSASAELAQLEQITDSENLKMLETAALYHDAGFMNVYKGHEEEGCRIAREVLPGFSYSAAQIDTICGMILATKVPQDPHTALQRILCDADLDYLGRDDFKSISATLFNELKARQAVTGMKDWNETQINFFKSHFYWNKSQRERRDAMKAKNLAEIKTMRSAND